MSPRWCLNESSMVLLSPRWCCASMGVYLVLCFKWVHANACWQTCCYASMFPHLLFAFSYHHRQDVLSILSWRTYLPCSLCCLFNHIQHTISIKWHCRVKHLQVKMIKNRCPYSAQIEPPTGSTCCYPS